MSRPTLRLCAHGLCALLALQAAPAALAQTGAAPTPAQLFAQVSPSVWRVLSFDRDGLLLGQGSGVVTLPGQLVTNCHVLSKARQVQVRRDAQAAPMPAKLVLWDVQRDLCQLQVPGLQAPVVPLAAAATAAVGQPAYAIGHPKGLDLTMSAGLVPVLENNTAYRTLAGRHADISLSDFTRPDMAASAVEAAYHALSGDPALRGRLMEAASAYSWSTAAERYLKLYKDTLAG